MFLDGTVESISVIQGYSAGLGTELLIYCILSIFTIYLIILFFKKSKRFPKLYILYLTSVVIITLLDIIFFSSLNYPTEEIRQVFQGVINETYQNMGKGGISLIIWGLYMIKSKRVKFTFVE